MEEVPAVASCSSAAEPMAAVEDAAGAVEVASTGRAAVGAWACSARMASAASAVELAVPEKLLAMLTRQVYPVRACGIQLAAEAPAEGPAARAHCTAAAVALSGLEAPLRRRRAGLQGSRTRWTSATRLAELIYAQLHMLSHCTVDRALTSQYFAHCARYGW